MATPPSMEGCHHLSRKTGSQPTPMIFMKKWGFGFRGFGLLVAVCSRLGYGGTQVLWISLGACRVRGPRDGGRGIIGLTGLEGVERLPRWKFLSLKFGILRSPRLCLGAL